MKQIALVCSLGLSTSLLVQAMEKSAKRRGLSVRIVAIGASEVADVAPESDVLMLAPQVRYMRQSFEKYGKPLDVIEGMVYALADGDQALQHAERLLATGEARA